jgi:hypothetical protein
MGLRVSKPGYNVLTEPLNSSNIAFDSRYDSIGTVIQQGTCSLDTSVSFTAQATQPLLTFYVNSGGLQRPQFQVHVGASYPLSEWLPYTGVIGLSSFYITRFPSAHADEVGSATFIYSVVRLDV